MVRMMEAETLKTQTAGIHLADWVKVLLPTRHEIGHFGAIPAANLLAWHGKN